MMKKSNMIKKTTKKSNNDIKDYNLMSIEELNKECEKFKLPVRGSINHLIKQLNYNKMSLTLLKEECRKNKLKMTGKKEPLLKSLMFNLLHQKFRKSDDYIDEQKQKMLESKSFLNDKEKKLLQKSYGKKLIERFKEYTYDDNLKVYLSNKSYNTFYKYVIEDDKDKRISKKYNKTKKQFEELTCADLHELKRENLEFTIPTILEQNEHGNAEDNIRKRDLNESDDPEENINDYFCEILDF